MGTRHWILAPCAMQLASLLSMLPRAWSGTLYLYHGGMRASCHAWCVVSCCRPDTLQFVSREGLGYQCIVGVSIKLSNQGDCEANVLQ